jgi:bifunctional enzyme CysN/CysC
VRVERPAAFDLSADNPALGRFVLVDGYEIAGGGVIREALPDRAQWARDKVLLRNYKWEPSAVPAERRAERLGQRALALVFTGGTPTTRKAVARAVEARLFETGRLAYFLGIGNVIHGIGADIASSPENRAEQLRRLAEVANVLLDAGLIALVTAADLAEADVDILRASVDPGLLDIAWIGDRITTDLGVDIHIPDGASDGEAADRVISRLRERGAIFRSW